MVFSDEDVIRDKLSREDVVDSKKGTRLNEFPRSRDVELFENYVTYDAEGKCDSSGILSEACFQSWLSKQIPAPADPKGLFKEVIFMHLTGSQGRRPFKKEVEADLLNKLKVGVLGYHEMQQLNFLRT